MNPESLALPTETTRRVPIEPAREGVSCVDTLKASDSATFDAIVHQHSDFVSRLVNRLVGWGGDVDDIVQSVFVEAWLQIHRFRGESSVSTWLYGIAVNKCREAQRRREIWNRCFGKLCEWWSPTEPCSGEDPGREQFQQIRHAMNELSQRDRELIVLVHLEERPMDEIASILKVKRNTLEVRLHRARQRLGKHLRRNHESIQ